MNAVKSLNHVGIAVRSIEDQRSFFEETLGMEFEGFENVPSQKVRAGFFAYGQNGLER